MDWIQLAQDRVQSPVLVIMVIKADQCNSFVAMSRSGNNEENFGYLLTPNPYHIQTRKI
jgi:hypothetical protein